MRALIPTTILLTAAEGASAHALDTSHSLMEQLAHQFGSPHHIVLLLGFGLALVAAYRYLRARRQRDD